MQKRKRQQPAYRQRKGYDQAIVTLTDSVTRYRKDYWLGLYDSPQSRELYHRVLAQWESGGRRLPVTLDDKPADITQLSVGEVLNDYWKWASKHYGHSELFVSVDPYAITVNGDAASVPRRMRQDPELDPGRAWRRSLVTFDDPHRVQRIVEELTGGDPQSAAEMLSLAYEELRSMAAGVLHRGDRHQTLQPTALVHELYLRLTGHADGVWHDRCHFLAVASMAMRQIVMDHARQRRAEKRGGGWDRVTLSDVVGSSPLAEADLIALDSALTKLDQLNERQARIVELRFLAGLTVEEVATLLDVSEATVKRDWRMARAWLMNELSAGE